MKHQWFAYIIVAVLSIGAGVAIAGLPNNVPVDATIIPPTTTEAPEPTAPTTTVAAAPITTEPETTEPETTEPATTDTTDPVTTDSAPVELPERSQINIGAANGSGIAGTAAQGASRLESLGYNNVAALDGTEVVDFTRIYYADGFEPVALRLADELGVLADFVSPLADAPEVLRLPGDIELLAYIGIDRAR